MNTCLSNLDIILYLDCSLNIYEYLKYHQHQYYHNQLTNDSHIHMIQSFFILSTDNFFKHYPNKMEVHLFQNPFLKIYILQHH